jgi:LuxR family quorum sensing-dependent transcriptional regulator
MLKVHSEALDFIERTQNLDRLSDLIDEFSNMADRQGFGTFILTGIPTIGFDVEPLVVANRWPKQWSDRYREQVYFPDDPVSRWSMQRDRPFRWTEARNAVPSTKRVLRIGDEAKGLGLVDGLVLPLRASRRWQAVVSLASDTRVDLSRAEEALLFAAATYFHMKADEIRSRTLPPLPRLSPREREVIAWCAAGKTAWEISRILVLSENTIRNQMKAILRKLDAATTTQAVTIAIARGEIQP